MVKKWHKKGSKRLRIRYLKNDFKMLQKLATKELKHHIVQGLLASYPKYSKINQCTLQKMT